MIDQTRIRLLPWTGPEGKPCYLATDGHGYLSRLADNVEAVQLGMAADLLGHAQSMLGEPSVGAGELRFLSSRLTEALRDTVRVAESRGARLPAPDGEGGEDDEDDEDDE
ncbi:hypothetical protein J7E91_12125 [Streptomyces sp. ISL-99]|uniref:hypothetical protein n=1 Tax=Streptomyces sp. ISL-99 TaxID=2819193 RepID=UPI001BE9174F|nr:hypothetical protein [Streptomyces sp. ISL-99]MBT2526168.1 hypothetical protein [Streptomyces sp. ISL-99]